MPAPRRGSVSQQVLSSTSYLRRRRLLNNPSTNPKPNPNDTTLLQKQNIIYTDRDQQELRTHRVEGGPEDGPEGGGYREHPDGVLVLGHPDHQRVVRGGHQQHAQLRGGSQHLPQRREGGHLRGIYSRDRFLFFYLFFVIIVLIFVSVRPTFDFH